MAEQQQLTLAEERDIIKRLGPTAMRAILNERGGIPCRMARAEVTNVDWAAGEISIREFGDTADKDHVRWQPPYYPGLFDSVWYLKFGDDGIVLGPSLGDYDEWAVSDYAKCKEASDVASVSTTSATFVSASGFNPFVTLWAEQGEPINITVSCMFAIDTSGVNGSVFTWRATGAATDGDVDEDGCETGHQEWTPGTRTTLWHPPTNGTYQLEIRHRRIGSVGTATFKHRRIRYERVGGYA